jgi:hypothetical protein
MTMASGAQRGVFGPTSWVVLHGGARPVVDGIAQTDVRSLAARGGVFLLPAPVDN